MAQEKGFAPGVLDRLMGASEASASRRTNQPMTLEQLKISVARDLEALLNTRIAIPEEHLNMYPRCRASVLNYGVRDPVREGLIELKHSVLAPELPDTHPTTGLLSCL